MTELIPVEIKLRKKYLNVAHGRHKFSGDHQGVHKRGKIGYAKHVALYGEPPVKVMVVGPTGKKRMRTVAP